MLTIRNYVVLIALLSMTCVCDADGQASVEALAVNYISDWKSGGICDAIDRDWDCKVLVKRILGDDYGRLSANDQNYIVHLQLLMIKASQNMPGVSDLVTKAHFSEGTITEIDEGEYLYSFELTIDPDTPTSYNALHVMRQDDRFVIIDVQHNGRGVIDGLKPIYQQMVEEKVSPVVWMEQMVAGILNQSSQLREQKAAPGP